VAAKNTTGLVFSDYVVFMGVGAILYL